MASQSASVMSKVYKVCSSRASNYGCVSINPFVSCVLWLSYNPDIPTHPATATMTSRCGRHKAAQAGGFLGRFVSLAREVVFGAEVSRLYWCGRAPVSVVFILFGHLKKKKPNPLLEKRSTVRTLALSAGSFNKNQSFSLSFYEKAWWENFFFSITFFCCMRWEREGTHKKTSRGIENRTFWEGSSQCRPCAMIWSVLTELRRGMEKIIRRNVWGALKQSGPRDRPMGEELVEQRVNFFPMNSTACSTMQSDCWHWAYIWSAF